MNGPLLCLSYSAKERICAASPLSAGKTLFRAAIAEGVPKLLEHRDLRWITVAEIPRYEFCPADREILAELKRRTGSGTEERT